MAYTNPPISLSDGIKEDVNTDDELDYKCLDQVYFAFIDVLGFKKTFDDIKISFEKDKLNKYKDVFNYYFQLMNAANFMKNKKENSCYAGQTSDSLYFYTQRPDFLVQFMRIFSHFNLYAMSKDVFFRGGIAKGNLYVKDMYQFYGASVIYAYLLESVISKNPIIVIDEMTNNDLKDIKGYRELVSTRKERHYIKPFELLDKKVILDIENFTIRDIDVGQVRKNIEDNKRLFEYDDKNYEKYVFLQNELNDCNNIVSEGI